MRTTKQLLKLLLAKGEELAIKSDSNIASMCWWTIVLYDDRLITSKEFDKLREFITSNRPTKGKFYDPNYRNSSLFWSLNNFNIRIAWIKYHIRRRLI